MEENGYMYMYAESLCCSPEIVTTLFISYTATQNKKFTIKKKKASIFKKIYLAALGIWDLRSSLWLVGSLIVARGIQFPDQGSNFCPPTLGTWRLSLWMTREVSSTNFLN